MTLKEKKMEMVRHWDLEDGYRIAKQLGIKNPEEFDDNYELAERIVDKLLIKMYHDLLAIYNN